MADVVVFLGPSLPGDEAIRLLPEATFLPPVRLGDVCAAVLDGFDVIVIIDGYFEQVATVWHKEILWALSRRCTVYGASSMGALRAAELAPFGMCGVGRIFERFLAGTYNDDDEVTIIHSADTDYRPLSTAMVSIRALLEDAVADGLCSVEQAAVLLHRSKKRHFSERSWAGVLQDARELGMEAERIGRLRAEIDRPGADAKAKDAAEVLRRARLDVQTGNRPVPVPFDFEPTNNFDKLLTIVRAERSEASVVRRLGESSAEIRARLDPSHLPLLHLLVDKEAARLGLQPGDLGGVTAVERALEAAGTTQGVAAELLRIESLRTQLEERHHLELAVFTESALAAACRSPNRVSVEGRYRAVDGNRLDDGRVVR